MPKLKRGGGKREENSETEWARWGRGAGGGSSLRSTYSTSDRPTVQSTTDPVHAAMNWARQSSAAEGRKGISAEWSRHVRAALRGKFARFTI